MNNANPNLDVEAENEYWRRNYRGRPYVDRAGYEDFGPAYEYGLGMYVLHGPRGYDAAEPDLERGWNEARGTSRLSWDRARHAVKDAWDRLTARSRPDGGDQTPIHDPGVRS